MRPLDIAIEAIELGDKGPRRTRLQARALGVIEVVVFLAGCARDFRRLAGSARRSAIRAQLVFKSSAVFKGAGWTLEFAGLRWS